MSYRNCSDCIEYAEVRRPAIVPAMHHHRQVTGETSEQILDRFMRGVHQRHLAGLPILPAEAVA